MPLKIGYREHYRMAEAGELTCHADLNLNCKDGKIIPILHPLKIPLE